MLYRFLYLLLSAHVQLIQLLVSAVNQIFCLLDRGPEGARYNSAARKVIRNDIIALLENEIDNISSSINPDERGLAGKKKCYNGQAACCVLILNFHHHDET